MIKDIEEHRIIGVIVKDLSRLGRESSKTGFYVQEYFPEHRVRFIAIDDNVDKNYCFVVAVSTAMGHPTAVLIISGVRYWKN
jgi:DNA invertase Pin-like site-specific DNA recombinase